MQTPLPGQVQSIKVAEGDTVGAGQVVCIIEAMKMQNEINTAEGGTVEKILVAEGQSVLEGEVLLRIRG